MGDRSFWSSVSGKSTPNLVLSAVSLEELRNKRSDLEMRKAELEYNEEDCRSHIEREEAHCDEYIIKNQVFINETCEQLSLLESEELACKRCKKRPPKRIADEMKDLLEQLKLDQEVMTVSVKNIKSAIAHSKDSLLAIQIELLDVNSRLSELISKIQVLEAAAPTEDISQLMAHRPLYVTPAPERRLLI